MEIQRYWAVVRKWLWLIMVGIVVAGGISYFLSQRVEPVYRATATLLVRRTENPSSIVSSYSGAVTTTYAELITGRHVMEGVISELNLSCTPGELSSKIDASTRHNTPLIDLSVEHTSPVLAQQIANTTAQVFSQRYQEQLLSETNRALGVIDSEITQLEENKASPGLTAEEENRLNELYTLRTLWRVQLIEAQAAGGVVPWEAASLPTSPVKPQVAQNVILACILGLVVTTGGAFFVEYLRRSVETAEDISRLTGLPFLGAIMRFKVRKGQKGGVITEAHPRSSAAEAFRVVRTNLQFSTLDKPAHALLITSPAPGEGKTTVLVNLAVSLAQTGKGVIIVDADFRHPELHALFELPNTFGFGNLLLAQQPDVAGSLQQTNVEGLQVLTSGPRAPNPAELLGSPRVDFVIEGLKKKADIILFDSAPVLAVADCAILSPRVDGVILVAEAGRTKPEALAEAKEVLSRGNINTLGVVLNRVDVSGRGGYYYHYRYPYYYHYYGEEGEKKQRKRGSSASQGNQGFGRLLK